MIPTIAEAARLIAAKQLSPVELTEQCLARVERLEPQLHAFVTLTAERALQEARAAQNAIAARGPKSRLHGIPLGLKDIFETAGLRTTAHSRHLAQHVPAEDAAAAARLAAAGAVLMGKLATHEFAFGGPSFELPWPPARNPWNPAHFTGGSSSGTAAAVAAGMVLGGMGSDTSGSIRSPAAFCGVAGLKPTYGRVSCRGAFPLAATMDHAGPLAWTAEDCAILLQEIAGHDPRDPASVDAPVPDYVRGLEESIKGVRVGVPRHFFERDHRAGEETLQAIETALGVLRGLGAAVREVELPPLQDWHAAGLLIMLVEGYAVHEGRLKSWPEGYGESLRDRIALGAFISRADYDAALRRRGELRARLADAMKEVDLLACAAQPAEAPRIDAVPKWASFETPGYSMPFSVAGNPAISICCGFGPRGLPLALQFAARPFEEALLLRAAHAYERATQWRQRRPSLDRVL